MFAGGVVWHGHQATTRRLGGATGDAVAAAGLAAAHASSSETAGACLILDSAKGVAAAVC